MIKFSTINLQYVQLIVNCGGGRRLADGLRKQHVGTIRPLVWDTLEDFRHTGPYTWDEDSTLHARGRFSQTDEHLNYEMTFTAGTSLLNVGPYGKSRGGDEEQEENVATPEVHQRGDDVLPSRAT